MRAELYILLVAFAQIRAVAMAQEQPAAVILPSSVGSTIYITHVTVIDTETGKEAQDRTVVISGERISDVGDSKRLRAPAGANVVDGTGKYLIPGLWDMHVHGTNFDSTLPLYIANGVTGVREMWGSPDANKFRAELASKNIAVPHIYLASPIVDGKPPYWPDSIAVGTPEEARKVVDDQKRKGADFIKIYSELSRESYFAIIDEGRKQNIPVAGHVPDRISAWEATAAKQKSIAHLDGVPLACSNREQELWSKLLAARLEKDKEKDRASVDKEQDRVILEAYRSHSAEKCHRLLAAFKRTGRGLFLLFQRTAP